MDPSLQESQGLRIAIEGCGHGSLDAIYSSVQKACEARGWSGIDLLIIGGDFQAVRNASDLTVMSCPVKYRAIGDFHAYYSGIKSAPYLTIFVGGNHEASSYMWELYYGGWAAPNIYYMGAANVVRVGGVRIAGMSGIWKGYNYRKPHYERLPYNIDDIKSIYHVRELDVRKLLQLKTQVDIGISHDWPTAIEKHGDQRSLFRSKPDFEQESKDGTLGNQAASYVLDRLRPPYWFAAHLHCKFSAIKTFGGEQKVETLATILRSSPDSLSCGNTEAAVLQSELSQNADEIDLEDNEDISPKSPAREKQPKTTQEGLEVTVVSNSSVPLELREQLPAAFSRPVAQQEQYQTHPAGVTNKEVRFLALDKCLPGRKFLQLLELQPYKVASTPRQAPSTHITRSRAKFEYDPEWLAITRVFAGDLVLGNKNSRPARDLGEEFYRSLIDKELDWVNENIVKLGKLEIPENFELTAPPFSMGMPEIVDEGPIEYDNPQIHQFCELVGISNIFHASEEERAERLRSGPSPSEDRHFGGGRSRGGERGRGWSRGGHGRGFGNGRGGRGRGRAS